MQLQFPNHQNKLLVFDYFSILQFHIYQDSIRITQVLALDSNFKASFIIGTKKTLSSMHTKKKKNMSSESIQQQAIQYQTILFYFNPMKPSNLVHNITSIHSRYVEKNKQINLHNDLPAKVSCVVFAEEECQGHLTLIHPIL